MARSQAADNDPFRPPDIPIMVRCLHCGEEFDSYLIQWVDEPIDSTVPGFWCCPTANCDGKGFGFDILPVDPEYQDEHGGWVDSDEELEDEDAWNDDPIFLLDDEEDDLDPDRAADWGRLDPGPDLLGPSDPSPGDDWVGEDDIPF